MLFTAPQHIAEPDDPRIAAYRNLRDRDLRAEGRFITEGALLAERLLHSRFEIESVFVTAAVAPNFIAEAESGRHSDIRFYVAEAALMREIAGFDFHRGVLAIGRRPEFPRPSTLVAQSAGQPALYVACPATQTGENLGMILRSAQAFGVHGMLLSAEGADALARKCLRQSMGAALAVPLAHSTDLPAELAELRHHGLQLVAAVAAENAAEAGREASALSALEWPPRSVLLVGNEYAGLSPEWLGLCDHLVTIPLAPCCDSLNVAVATGILLHRAAHRL